MPRSLDYNDNLADISDGASCLFSFASFITSSSSGNGIRSGSGRNTHSDGSGSEQGNFGTMSDDSEWH